MQLSLQLTKFVRVCFLRPSKPVVFLLSNKFLTAETHSGESSLADLKRINIRIRECMRRGLVRDAHQLFDGTPHRNTVSWNSMIRGYFQNGDLSLGMILFDQMPHRDIFSYNTVIAGLMRFGESDRAIQIFEGMPVRDVVSWNSVIAGCVQNSMMDEALHLFDQMPERNVISLNLVMTGLVNRGSLDLAERLFNELPTRDVASWTIMISGLAGHGRIDDSARLFDEMPVRDLRSWNAMLAGYVQNGMIKHAESLFLKMPERDSTSWKKLITGLVGSQRLDIAVRYFMEMPQRDPISWNSILLGLIKNGYVEEGHALFEKCPFKDVVSWTNMIIGYFELGDVGAACKLFRLMDYRDETSWNATIFGLGENDHGESGLKLFTEMRLEGFNPDQATYTSVLNICSSLPAMDFGKQSHGQIIKSGFDNFLQVCNAVITMYARCGSISSASMAFSYMPIHDTVSWNSIICGFSHHGKGKEALSLFTRMRLTNLKPDRITFIGVLSACSHAGLIAEGRHYYYVMVYKYFLKPSCEHYTCIVDLLGRFGFVEEAAGFIERMRGHDGVEASASVWGALLGACRIHGRAEIGEVAGERVLEMEPWNAGAYLILAEIYMGCGKRRDAERVLVLMKERRVKKQPGCSWIDVLNSVHVFLADDSSHPQITSVCNMLGILDMEMGLI